MSSETFLDAAMAIGRRLCSDAIWHRGVCSWVGPAGDPRVASEPEYRPAGPLLYDGTAGIGLFLAQLADVTGDAGTRGTAVGALRHAVARVSGVQTEGFHGGGLGVAWAAAHAGSDEFEEAARALAASERSGVGPDLVDGEAGSLIALLGLWRLLDEPALLEAARARGASLLANAIVTSRGWAWRHPTRRDPRPLCGVAHGAGGVGAALLEMHAATGEPRFRDAALDAFAYERSWRDAETGTWPDLRLPVRRGRGFSNTATVATWCYGEAGMALSRLRAKTLLGDGAHCHDANICVAATRQHVATALPYAIADLSLCHGLGGAAEALLAAGEIDAASALGEIAVGRHGGRGDWPCGMVGTSPNLFRGMSGIGWLFLRLFDPGIPSPLALPNGVDTGAPAG